MTQAELFRALSSDLRLRLFKLTLRRPYCVQALARVTRLTESAISQQMRILREAGLVTAVKHGYHTHFSADKQAVTALLAAFSAETAGVEFDPHACGCREADRECHCGSKEE